MKTRSQFLRRLQRACMAATLLALPHMLVAGDAARSQQSATVVTQQSPTTNTGHAHDSAVALADGRSLTGSAADETGGTVEQTVLAQAAVLSGRSGHSSTLLMDGRVLIAGGETRRGADFAELWNPRTGQRETTAGRDPRGLYHHTANLLKDGKVLLISTDRRSSAVFDPATRRFSAADAQQIEAQSDSTEPLHISASLPAAGSRDAATDSVIALRFSPALPESALAAANITLVGPHGAEKIRPALAEDGKLLFITPEQELYPASRYVVFIRNLGGVDGKITTHSLEFQTGSIAGKPDERLTWGATAKRSKSDTASAADSPVADPAVYFGLGKARTNDPEFWTPKAENSKGRWRSEKPLPPDIREEIIVALSELTRETAWREGSLRTLAATEGQVSGRVLRFNDEPLTNVSVRIGERTAMTDDAGRFLLTGVEPGHREVVVDGRSAASGKGGSYGQFVIGLDVQAGKQTPLKPVYLPKLREQDWIDIPSPLPDDLVVSNPYMPGFEVHLPKGAVLRDREGKIVRRIAVAPVPLDRTPVDYPVNTPLHMSLQPAGLQVESLHGGAPKGMQFVYPNYSAAAPGSRAGFLNYDPSGKGWYTYGYGTVSKDGLRVIPDTKAEVYRATGFAAWFGLPPPPLKTPSCAGSAQDGDPVDLRTGLFRHRTEGPYLEDAVPLDIRTHYRPDDTTIREFGVGTSHRLGMYLHMPPGANQNPHASWAKLVLVLGDCSTVEFNVTSGSANTGNLYEATSTTIAGPFYGAKLYNGDSEYNSGPMIFTRDGTRYRFNVGGGALLDIKDRYGRKLELTRVGGNISRITTASGRFVDVTMTYDIKVTNLTDIGNRSWSYEYNTDHTLKKVTFPDGTFERYVYANGRMTEVWDRRGNRMVLNTYDSAGRVQTQTLADNTQFLFSYTTNAAGDVVETQVTRPNGAIRRVRFDSNGFLSEDTEALGTPLQRTTQYEFDEKGFLLSTVDPLLRRTEYVYDAGKHLTSVTTLAGTSDALTRSYTYTAKHDIATVTDEEQRVTTFTYDDRRRLTHVAAPFDRAFRYEYDLLSNVSKVTDERTSRATRLEYKLYDVHRVIDADNRTSEYFTDAVGRVRAQIDPMGRRSEVHYYDSTRTVEFVDAHGGITRQTFDPKGNLAVLTDPKQSTTSWTYDAMQRVLTRTDALLQTDSWSYAPNGSSISHTDRKLQSSMTAIDLLSRPVITIFSDSTTQSFAYDFADRVTEVADDSGAIRYSYDSRDLLQRETVGSTYIDYGYDSVGRLLTVNPSSTVATVYQYDARKRLASLTRGSETVTYEYDSLDRRSRVTLPNGVSTVATYGVDNRLQSLTYANGSTILGNLTYQYDLSGLVTHIGGSFAPSMQPPASAALGTADANHRLTTFDGVNVAHDANGNMISDGVFSYVYDARNRLTEIHDGSTVVASFGYDAVNRRISRVQGSLSTTYRYDGYNAIKEHRSGSTPSSVDIFTGSNIDERFAIDDTEGRNYFLNDHLGNVIGLAGQNGALQTRYKYSPYGTTEQETVFGKTSQNPYQYTGRENDGNGVYYFRTRYLNSLKMRFLSEDSAKFSDGPNNYAYAKGNPIQLRDPLGFSAIAPAIPAPAPVPPLEIPIPWETIRHTGARALPPLLLLYPSPITGHPCEMAGGPSCSLMWSKPSRQQRPDDCPTGTKPIDRFPGLDREKIHKIKDGVRAGPNDWVGITPDGHVITNEDGSSADQGPYEDYLP